MLRKSIALAMLLSGCSLTGAEKAFEFRDETIGQPPRGFSSIVVGEGRLGDWQVIQDDVPSLVAPLSPKAPQGGKQRVLAQLSRDRTDERFPILIYDQEVFGDFTFTTRFKMVEGETEQMAGIAFRIQDERNFYYVRASGLGNNFYFFKVLAGQRQPPIGNSVQIAKGVWHDLSIECKGTKIRCLLNGQAVIPELDDKSLSTGRIGFLTKSDAVSYFTDAVIVYRPKETLAQSLVKDAFKKYPRLQGLKIYAPDEMESPLKIVASLDPSEVGTLAPEEAGEVLAKKGYYYGKGNSEVMLTLPLHDSNGDKVAAVRVVMKSFLGQTEKNALARAMPVVKGMESRIQTLKDLIQ